MDSLYITGTELVPSLVSMLTSDDRYIRIKAASSLGALGAVAEKAIPALRRAEGHGSLKVSKAAEKAIEEIDESRAKIAAERGWGRP